MSVVRDNLLSKPGYTPYCGEAFCWAGWPRTTFENDQFQCRCGWRSSFEPDFIERYKARRNADATSP